MSATGLDVFDKTLQTTNIWLDEVMADIGPDRKAAWHVLGVVLRALRDRVPGPLAAHLGVPANARVDENHRRHRRRHHTDHHHGPHREHVGKFDRLPRRACRHH